MWQLDADIWDTMTDKELTRDWYTDVASDLTRGVPELSPQLPTAPRQVNVHPTGKA